MVSPTSPSPSSTGHPPCPPAQPAGRCHHTPKSSATAGHGRPPRPGVFCHRLLGHFNPCSLLLPPSTLPPCSALQDNFFSYFSGSVDATTWNLPSPLAHTLFSTQTHSCPLAGEPDPDPSSHFYELDQLIPLLWNITPLPLTGSRSPHPPPPRCKLGSPPGWGKLPS